MRKQACLVCIAVLLVFAPPLLAGGEAAGSAGSDNSLVPAAASARALPPISMVARESLQAQEPPDPELFDDSPLETELLLLAAWLPIAAAVIAVAMEGGSPTARQAREPGGEPSLD